MAWRGQPAAGGGKCRRFATGVRFICLSSIVFSSSYSFEFLGFMYVSLSSSFPSLVFLFSQTKLLLLLLELFFFEFFFFSPWLCHGFLLGIVRRTASLTLCITHLWYYGAVIRQTIVKSWDGALLLSRFILDFARTSARHLGPASA